RRAAADARDERIAGREAPQLSRRLRRNGRVVGPWDDRREHAVDVEQNRRSRGILGQAGERVHAAYDTAVRLVVIGLVAGFFSALFGVGGGILIVPLLLLAASWEHVSATATSLSAIRITAVDRAL